MLVQQISQLPTAPPPRLPSDNIHIRVNDQAPPSVLQLGKDHWSASQSEAQSKTPSTTHSRDPSPHPSTARTSTTSRSKPKPKPITPSVQIRPATPSDAEQIRTIGATVFSDTFGFSIPPADLSAYITSSYALPAIRAELASLSHHFVVAHPPHDPTHILGFAQLTEHTSEPCLSHLPPGSYSELQRLYVNAESHGKGVGKALVWAIEDLAREKGYRYMWLGVWEGNFVAQTVYERAGYGRVGEHEFTMGRCVQIDWIMVKEL
ncbi:uncharacterized protein HMPREF1541_10338 [Cyphellophora europaea CBS 101466]|uniref:N-acetyltransferase domain-containing protein n=1 Tax=Cyphellophora europaea (strain CBS 101466) TaxID=1220924 RepID=W2S9F7_CYPE1|nr:uncharacterized protein HMPREF1541_10338 [Cyphellophora europaea CBS 101466]ETN44668.1 hypothetical protein HMPREF1541_10338 [Cyphellophora europaea CBS 101466]